MRLGWLGLLLVSQAALAQTPQIFTVQAKDSKIVFHVIHKFHRVDGVSKNIEGRAALLPGGRAQVEVRVAAESFDSGNVNRDAHMKETIEAARYPWVELKAIVDGVTPPATFPATVEATAKAQLTFHGVQQRMEVPVKLLFQSAKQVRAQSSFTVSLDACKVERPSLMFVKVDDQARIDADLLFVAQ